MPRGRSKSTKRSSRSKISRRKLSRRQKSSATRGWGSRAPKLISERRKMMEKCGSKCFLLPSKLKFPICDKNTCRVNCKGIVAAKVRSGEWKYKSVQKRANRMINSRTCTIKSRSKSRK